MSALDVVVIGAQKSATTTVRVALANHPDIYVPHGESQIFDAAGATVSGIERELLKLRRRAGTRRLAIKRADLLTHPTAASLMHGIAPQTKLVCVVRDPLRRAISAFSHYVAYRLAPDIDTELGLQLLLDRQLDARYPRAREVLVNGLYYEHLSRWMNLWDASLIHVMRQEDLRADPHGEFGNLALHLGVAPFPVVDIVTNRGAYSDVRKSWRRLAMTFRGDESSPLSKMVGRAMVSADARVLSKIATAQPVQLSDELTARLTEFYAKDQAQLNSLLGGV